MTMIRLFVRTWLMTTVIALMMLGRVSLAFAAPTTPDQGELNERLQPLLKTFCHDCHGRTEPEAGIDLASVDSWTDLQGDPRLIEKLIDVLQKNEMPPPDAQQPTDAQRDDLLQDFTEALRQSLSRGSSRVPVRLRRMNRFEYGNAVRDLFDLESWVYSINDRIIRDHSHYFRPETGKMPEVVVVGNRMMGLQQLLENRLLGVMPFPKDAPAENGFNNRGDHLSLTPVLMQAFLELSQSIVNAENFDENCGVWKELFEDPANPRPVARVVNVTNKTGLFTGSGLTISAWIRPTEASDSWQTIVRREDGWRRQLLSMGRTGAIWGLWMGAGISGQYVEFGASIEPELLTDGRWHHVAGSYDGKRMNLYLDGQRIGQKDLVGELYTQSGRPMEIGSYGKKETFHGDLKGIRLYRSGLNANQIHSITLGKQQVADGEIVGSWDPMSDVMPELNAPIDKIARDRIEAFLTRAFRAPPSKKTLTLYQKYFDQQYRSTGQFTQSMKRVVSAALASPRFIHVHHESGKELPRRECYHLATGLAFFLWSSIPDRDLLDLARDGSLRKDEVLAGEIDRMLNDPRVKNFCDSFAPQWLKLNNLVSASPDFERHREYYFGGDDKISYKRGMHMMLEPLLNFETVFVENRSILELVDSDFSYRSHLLTEWYQGRAATYPINVNLRDIEFKRTLLDDRRYGGVVTTSAVMAMTSNPTRSLPITRGAWVASVIFNDPPEPPPDNIPDLVADDKTLQEEGLTVRQKLKLHSSDSQCSGCHRKIDPFGFVLENYDLLGRWRDVYRTGIEVDASGTLFGRQEFTDVIGFKDAIRLEKQIFATAFIRHLLSYALGRELGPADRFAAVEIAAKSESVDYRMRDVIKNIVLHPVFRQK